jgi:beta-N-acetylhexosaminidase
MARETYLSAARSVLLPVASSDGLSQFDHDFLRGGGRALLLGESREEYVARAMSDARREAETGEWFSTLTTEAAQSADAPILIAIDQELGGIQRMHDLVTPLPTAAEASWLDSEAIRAAARLLATELAQLGVNFCLAPVVDVVVEPTPWLDGRTLGTDPAEVGRIAAAYIAGLQATGRVAATAKHFPGHRRVAVDPALAEAVLESTRVELETDLKPFRLAIQAGTRAVMLGPTLVPAIDALEPSSTSSHAVALLRDELGFSGVIVTDDLDEPSIARGRSVPAAAIDALRAGADLLLISGGEQIEQVAQTIAGAVETGALDASRLEQARARVAALADSIAGA